MTQIDTQLAATLESLKEIRADLVNALAEVDHTLPEEVATDGSFHYTISVDVVRDVPQSNGKKETVIVATLRRDGMPLSSNVIRHVDAQLNSEFRSARDAFFDFFGMMLPQPIQGDTTGPLGLPDGRVDAYDAGRLGNDYLKGVPADPATS